MSNWKVIKTKIEVFDHPDADRLQLGKVGTYQVVVQKGLYEGGETVVFAPEKSVLSGELEKEYKDYLVGPDNNRVKAMRLRNELSCGIIIPPQLVEAQCGRTIDELPDDEDLSEVLGITKYVPTVPKEMEGTAEPIEHEHNSTRQDVEQYGVYRADFVEGERVVGTEKLHGSQVNVYAAITPKAMIVGDNVHRWLSTKNYNAEGLCLTESDTNFYWRAVNAISLWEMIEREYLTDTATEERVVQVFGEALPCQKGFGYGQVGPTMRIFDIRVDGESVPYAEVPECFKEFWVPVLFDGPFSDEIKRFAKGMEQMSGTEAHIREGMVIRPYIDRRAGDGTRLAVKVINPKYKETGEEFN